MNVFIGRCDKNYIPELNVGDYVLFYINKRKNCFGEYGIIISTGNRHERFKIYCQSTNVMYVRARSSIAQLISRGS